MRLVTTILQFSPIPRIPGAGETGVETISPLSLPLAWNLPIFRACHIAVRRGCNHSRQ
jgi:hypothetical protein